MQSNQQKNIQRLGKITFDFGVNLLSSFQNKIISNFQTVSKQVQELNIKQRQVQQSLLYLQQNSKQMNKFIQSIKQNASHNKKKQSKPKLQIKTHVNDIQVKKTKNEEFGINTQRHQVQQTQSQYQQKNQIQCQIGKNQNQQQGSLLQSYINQIVKRKVQQFLIQSKKLQKNNQKQNDHEVFYPKKEVFNQKKDVEKEIQSEDSKIKLKAQQKQDIPLQISKNRQVNQNQVVRTQKMKQQKLEKDILFQTQKENEHKEQKQKFTVPNVKTQVKTIDEKDMKKILIETPNLDLQKKLVKQLSLKFIQLNARVYKMEQSFLNQIKVNNKKFNDLQKSIQDSNFQMRKNQKTSQSYEEEVQKLRNQLNEYKLKKQSKLMKIINSTSVSSNSKNGNTQQNQINKYIQFLAQKIEYLLKAIPQLVPKQRYNEDIQYIHQIFGSFKKKITNVVIQNDLQIKLNLMEKRLLEELAICFQAKQKDQNKSKLLKLLQEKTNIVNKHKQKEEKTSGQNKNQNKNQKQEEQTYKSKIINSQKLLNSIMEQFDQVKKSIRKMKNVQYPELQTSIVLQKQITSELKEKINNHQNFFRDMNNQYNKKLHEIQGQIINDQENLDKINNQLKFYKFTNFRSQATTKPESISNHYHKNQTQINQMSSSSVQHTKSHQINGNQIKSEQYIVRNNLNMKKSLEIPNNQQSFSMNPQNEIQQLKKKFGKLSIVVETLKSEITALRGDLYRDMESIKVNQDKKTDWQTFKKGMAYFDQRFKQTNVQINQIILTIQNSQKEESTAAKKGWTCLCCDKDIKSFQGRLGQAKFMNVFPGKHQSPRIGGYYKQSSKQKQYNQIYLNKNRKNSIPKIQKEDFPQIK